MIVFLLFTQIWSSPQKISIDTLGFYYLDPRPYARDSVIWVTWLASRWRSFGIFATFYDGEWHRPKIVSIESTTTWVDPPAIAIDTNYTPYVLFISGRREENPFGNLYWSKYESGVWLPPAVVFPDSWTNQFCEAICDHRGRIWVIWGRRDHCPPLRLRILSTYYENGIWHPIIPAETILLPSVDMGFIPSATNERNGKIRLVYLDPPIRFYSKFYDTTWSPTETIAYNAGNTPAPIPTVCCDSNGVVWAACGIDSEIVVARNYGFGWVEHETISEARIRRTKNIDPSICCDKGGTIWITWQSFDSLGYYKILARYYRNGQWSSITQVNPDSMTERYLLNPPKIVYSDKKIWVFWTYQSHIYVSWTPLLGIKEENKKLNKIKIYSNLDSLPFDIKTIKLYDISGKIIKVKNFKIKEGIYFIEMDGIRKKIVITNKK